MKGIDFTKLETWVHGLFAAVISSGATTGAALLSNAFGGPAINWKQLGISLGVSSLFAAFFYLKTSPLPDSGVVTLSFPPSSTTTTTVTSKSVPTTDPINK